MKFLVIFTLFLAISTAIKEEEIVDEYFKKYGNRGVRSFDFEKRKKILLKNFNKINDHNAKFQMGIESYQQEVNGFSQLDDEELKVYGGFEMPEGGEKVGNSSNPPDVKGELRRGRASIPDYWNWAEVPGVVQPVQDQGACGCCYVS